MREIWRMWNLVCFLNERHHYLSNFRERPSYIFRDTFQSVYKKTLSLTEQGRVERLLFALEYGTKLAIENDKNKEGKGETDEETDRRAEEELLQSADLVQSTITSCIDNGYLATDKDDINLIYLTSKGKHFADLFGLFKAWIKEMGILWTSMLWMLSVIGAVVSGAHWSTIWATISKL